MIRAGDDELGGHVARDMLALRAALRRRLARLRRGPIEPPTPPDRTVHGAFGYPIMVEVRGRSVVVAGGRREAAHKAEVLAELGATVIVWAPVHAQTSALIGRPGVELRSGPFDPAILAGAVLAIVATGDRDLDRRIAAASRSSGVLVNTVDDVPNCDWSAPAILRRGDLTIAVATAGIAPALAVRLRDRLAYEIGPEYAGLLEIFALVRPRIMASGRSFADRKGLWYELVDGPALDHLRGGRADEARHAIEAEIANWEAAS